MNRNKSVYAVKIQPRLAKPFVQAHDGNVLKTGQATVSIQQQNRCIGSGRSASRKMPQRDDIAVLHEHLIENGNVDGAAGNRLSPRLAIRCLSHCRRRTGQGFQKLLISVLYGRLRAFRKELSVPDLDLKFVGDISHCVLLFPPLLRDFRRKAYLMRTMRAKSTNYDRTATDA